MDKYLTPNSVPSSLTNVELETFVASRTTSVSYGCKGAYVTTMICSSQALIIEGKSEMTLLKIELFENLL